MRKTHDEVKKEFVEAMETAIDMFDKIDKDTTYTISEPIWWCDMMDLSRHMRTLILAHKSI